MNRKHLAAVGREFKAVGNQPGMISGYGSVFNVEDSWDDIVAPGAFTKSLAESKASGRLPAMLWQHNMDEPIGVWTEMVEDSVGLKCVGQLLLSVPKGAEAYEHVKAGTVSGLSIGFQTIERSWNSQTDIRTLLAVNLMEVSLVTIPACDPARVQDVKGGGWIDEIMELKDAERLLRDAGDKFSRTEAVAFVSRIKTIALREAAAGNETAALLRRAAAILK